MQQRDALRVVESLRKGIPPTGFVERFTVGRQSQIQELQSHLDGRDSTALLLRANYGSGKSHLLRLMQERALRCDFAVSYVQIDSKSGIRFNRMDQIMGAVLRTIEVPGTAPRRGTKALLDFVCAAARNGAHRASDSSFWARLSTAGRWDYSEELQAEAMYLAVRAWFTGEKSAQDLVVNWLENSANYRAKKRELCEKLVRGLRRHFRDPRPDNVIRQHDVFNFFAQGYRQSWGVLSDVDRLLRESGLNGLVLLFDEFEDVLTAMRINHQEAAFWNLFRFFSGERYPGKSFYAVTPGFAQKCKERLLEKKRFDFAYDQFDKLPTFSMDPLSEPELLEVGHRIGEAHSIAYSYRRPQNRQELITRVVARTMRSSVQDRVRHAIREIVIALDALVDG